MTPGCRRARQILQVEVVVDERRVAGLVVECEAGVKQGKTKNPACQQRRGEGHAVPGDGPGEARTGYKPR